MGMSASQMRYCMLTGRKSDVEYQGQQINQERTTLATETSAYNNQLLELDVPTPPSSDEYTTTAYTFASNGETRTVTGTVYDSDTSTYTVNYTTDTTTSQGECTGTSIFSSNTATSGTTTYLTSEGTALSLAITDEDSTGYSSTDASNIALIEQDCGIAKYTTAAGATLKSITTDSSSTKYNATDIANLQSIYGDDYDTDATYYKYTTGSGTTADPTVSHYVSADDIANSTGTSYTSGQVKGTNAGTSVSLNETQFYKYTDDGTTIYVLASDLASEANSTTAISTYDVNPDATVTESAKMTGAAVTWSSSGRMSSITDADGNDYSLNVSSVNDEDAYTSAYKEYEYQKSIYEHSISDINSQIDIVESQDKKLELKLQNLDTQQEALNTEMDSVKKVIDKNIEQSFKAFA